MMSHDDRPHDMTRMITDHGIISDHDDRPSPSRSGRVTSHGPGHSGLGAGPAAAAGGSARTSAAWPALPGQVTGRLTIVIMMMITAQAARCLSRLVTVTVRGLRAGVDSGGFSMT